MIIHKHTTEFYNDKNTGSAFLENKGSLTFIKFKCFEALEWLNALVTTRGGGVSTNHLSSLNLDFKMEPNKENVLENYRRVAQALDIKSTNIVKTHQVHKNNVELVTTAHLPLGPDIKHFPDTDGLFTNEAQLALFVSVADCIPVFLADTKNHAIALVHSGWRGTVGQIGAVAVNKLTAQGSNPRDIVALIGPGISIEHYEVSIDVIDEFNKVFSAIEMQDIAYQTDETHYQLDLWAACYYYLLNAGLLPSNIHFASICTYENHDLLFSHRYTNGLRGVQCAVSYIK